MASPTPYLNFPGTCEEAFTFYKKIFGGTLQMHRFKEMPPEYAVPSNHAEKLMHCTLTVDGAPFLMGSDVLEGYGPLFNAGNNLHLSLSPTDAAQAKAWYDALRNGGNVTMELTPTFWAELFAMLTDRFGVQWMISYGQPK